MGLLPQPVSASRLAACHYKSGSVMACEGLQQQPAAPPLPAPAHSVPPRKEYLAESGRGS
eukprot:1908440-Rhodomonas_salina.1